MFGAELKEGSYAGFHDRVKPQAEVSSAHAEAAKPVLF
jgi:hypothetical protein